jgi:DNA-binding phage protein
MRILEVSDVVSLLRYEIKRAGGQSAWARKTGIHRSEINKVINHQKPPSKTIIRALKLRMVVVSND